MNAETSKGTAVWDAICALAEPDSPSVTKEWHQHVTKDIRSRVITMHVKAAFPMLHSAAMHDQRVKDVILYSRKVEKEMFEAADDRQAYCRLLAERYRKDREKPREMKLEEMQDQSKVGELLTACSQPSEFDGLIRKYCFSLTRPIAPSIEKDYHQLVTAHERNCTALELVKAMRPWLDPVIVRERRIGDMVLSARMLEVEIFEAADTKSQYLLLLAKKYEDLRKENEDKSPKTCNEKKDDDAPPSTSQNFNV